MDRKMLTIILSVVLIGAFFLDWGGGVSAFDVIKSKYGDWQKYIILLIPLSGVLLLIGELNNGNYPISRNLLCWLPLLTVIYGLFIAPLIQGFSIGVIFKSLGKGYGIGQWITIAASLVLALYNPKEK